VKTLFTALTIDERHVRGFGRRRGVVDLAHNQPDRGEVMKPTIVTEDNTYAPRRYVWAVVNGDPHAEERVLGVFSNSTKAQDVAIRVVDEEVGRGYGMWTCDWYDEDGAFAYAKRDGGSGKHAARGVFRSRNNEVIVSCERWEVQ
jgi:hypothetical protein